MNSDANKVLENLFGFSNLKELSSSTIERNESISKKDKKEDILQTIAATHNKVGEKTL